MHVRRIILLLSCLMWPCCNNMTLVWVCGDTTDQLLMGGVVVWTQPANRKLMLERPYADTSPVINKMALHPRCFRSVSAPVTAAVAVVPHDKYCGNR